MIVTELFPYLILSAVAVFGLPNVRVMGGWANVFIAIGAVYAAVAGIETIIGGNTALLPGVDPVDGVFLLAVAVSGIACAGYAMGYTRDHAAGKSHTQLGMHFAALIVLFYSMIGVVSAEGSYGFLFWWELMTLSSFLLIMYDAELKAVRHAAVGYLVLMHIGFFLLVGAFVPGAEAFFGNDTAEVSSGYLSIPVFLLFLAGFGIKAGIFPLHVWLPVAHPAAPSHVSALMSGVMIKMGIYGILRSVAGLEPGALQEMGLLVFALGVVSAIFGIMRGAVQTDIKRLLAYSSIENIGIICMGIGLGTLGRAVGSDFIAYAGYGGALLHVLGHANYKTLLFLGAGSATAAARHRDMNLLGGLLRRMPITGGLFLAGTLAICATPALVGFTSEFVLVQGMFGAISGGELIVVSVAGIAALALVGGLTLMTFVKAFGITFLGNPRSVGARDAREVRLSMLLAQALPLAGIIVGPVLYSYLVLENLDVLVGARYYAQPTIDTMWTVELVGGLVVGIAVGLFYLKRWLNRRAGAPVEVRPTWGCAFTAPSKQMQYSATSFNRELQDVGATREGLPKFKEFAEEELFPGPRTFVAAKAGGDKGDRTARAMNRYFLSWLRRGTARLALFQTGKTNHYVLHGLLLLVLILVFTLCGVL